MRLTVLGSSASYAGPGQACSGHLVQAGTTSVLLDCGNGVLANLASVMDPAALDAIVITHEHIDHFADVYALQALLRYAPQGPAAPLPLHAPAGLFDRMACVLSESGRGELDEAFMVHELSAHDQIALDHMTITPYAVEHIDPTYALALREPATSRQLCYTSDTAPGEAVEDAAAGATLLLAEATLPQKYAGAVPHMTSEEAGALAARVGAERLVLAHIWPTNDREAMAREAASRFPGPVSVASEMDVYSV